MLVAASLDLKAEKQSAHSNYVTSVAFSPDGKTIVSGSYDQTLKVWDAGASARKSHVITFSALTVLVLLADTLDAKGEISDTGMAQVVSVSFSPDGSRIVGGGLSLDYSSGTLKVWDAGVSTPTHSNPLPIPDCPCACYSFPGAQGGEEERAQWPYQLCCLLS